MNTLGKLQALERKTKEKKGFNPSRLTSLWRERRERKPDSDEILRIFEAFGNKEKNEEF